MLENPKKKNKEPYPSPLIHIVSLALVMVILWLLLSGFFTGLLLGLGAVSIILVVIITIRMDVIDHEGHPIHMGPKAIRFWPWMIKEIILSNIDVARRIISPKMPIHPKVITVKASQKSDLGRAIYANSITLTPGTVSMSIEGDEIQVHALTMESAQALEEGEMDRRITDMENL